MCLFQVVRGILVAYHTVNSGKKKNPCTNFKWALTGVLSSHQEFYADVNKLDILLQLLSEKKERKEIAAAMQ